MKVILFTYLFPNKSFPQYGIFNFSRAKALKELGFEVIVIAPVSLNPHMINLFPKFKIIESIKLFIKILRIPEEEIYKGIKVYHPRWLKFPNKIFWQYNFRILHFFINKKIQKIFKYFDPELIISTWLNPFAVYSYYFKKDCRAINFAIAEGSDVLVHPFHYNGWKRIEKIINKNCDLIIAVSENMKMQIQQKTKLQNIKVIRNGYDKNSFFNSIGNNETNNKFKIITVSNFNRVKGHDILLRALQYLDMPFEITLVGSGPEYDKCNYFVHQNGLESVVHFLGEVPHDSLRKILLQNDVFCLPSRSEGLPAAPLEAMGCGLPVVSANVGGMNEIIIDGFNGFLFKAESSMDLSRKLMSAANTDWKRDDISAWVTANFSWDNWAAKIIKEYNSFIEERVPIKNNNLMKCESVF